MFTRSRGATQSPTPIEALLADRQKQIDEMGRQIEENGRRIAAMTAPQQPCAVEVYTGSVEGRLAQMSSDLQHARWEALKVARAVFGERLEGLEATRATMAAKDFSTLCQGLHDTLVSVGAAECFDPETERKVKDPAQMSGCVASFVTHAELSMIQDLHNQLVKMPGGAKCYAGNEAAGRATMSAGTGTPGTPGNPARWGRPQWLKKAPTVNDALSETIKAIQKERGCSMPEAVRYLQYEHPETINEIYETSVLPGVETDPELIARHESGRPITPDEQIAAVRANEAAARKPTDLFAEVQRVMKEQKCDHGTALLLIQRDRPDLYASYQYGR